MYKHGRSQSAYSHRGLGAKRNRLTASGDPLYTRLLRTRRGRLALWFLALYVLANFLFFLLAVGKDQWWRGLLRIWRNSRLRRDTVSEGLRLSYAREAARIPWLMLDRGFIGIDPGYAQHELPGDRAANGAASFTVEPISGLAPASAYSNIVVAHPPAAWVPQYRGRECQSTYPVSHCPFPGLCAPGDSEQPCVVWRSGEPASLGRVLSAGSSGVGADLSAKRPDTLDFDSPGRWLEDDLWHPYGPDMHHDEGYAFFTPEDAHRCFMGKRIMFSGDSMIRQMYTRVINYLRGIPTNAEHLYNFGTTSYVVFPDGTDKFTPSCPDRRCDIPSDSLYSIVFDWHDYQNYTWDVQRVLDLRADVVVQAIVYWRGCYEDLNELRDAFDRLLPDWRGQYTWYHSPEKRNSNYREFYWRNRRMRRWIEGHRARGDTRINALPADRLARLHNGRNIVRDRRPIKSGYDDVHFMATFLEADYPKPIKAGLQYVKAPMDWDTRDMFNFNLMQLWLNGICRPST